MTKKNCGIKERKEKMQEQVRTISLSIRSNKKEQKDERERHTKIPKIVNVIC
jgi:hypothetical protein